MKKTAINSLDQALHKIHGSFIKIRFKLQNLASHLIHYGKDMTKNHGSI
jgi:hypothetical protein